MQTLPGMRLSRFNVYVEGMPGPDDVLVHNTFAGSYVVLDRKTLARLRALDAGDPVDLADLSPSVAELSDRDVGVLCQSHDAEDAEFFDWFERRRARTDSLDVLVSINRACNFACPYCVQDGVMDGSVMMPSMAAQVGHWIGERADTVDLDTIELSFVGGEPLLHPDRIERVVDGVRQRTDRSVTYRLTTNGVFLAPSVVSRLMRTGLVSAQVTLDGDASTHHLTRVSKHGDDTFETIFSNVIAASEHIRIAINGNYQPNTVHGFAPLVDQLRERGLPGGSSVSFSPALDILDSPAGSGSGACTWSDSNTREHLALYDRIRGAGFDAPPVNEVGPCEFHDHHSFAIDPDGTIYKCPGFLAKPIWAIGHVESGLSERYVEMLAATPQPSCTGCAHRPNCGGGCVAEAFVEAGRSEGVTCEHGYFERMLPSAVLRNFVAATELPLDATALDPPCRPPGQDATTRAVRSAALRVVG